MRLQIKEFHQTLHIFLQPNFVISMVWIKCDAHYGEKIPQGQYSQPRLIKPKIRGICAMNWAGFGSRSSFSEMNSPNFAKMFTFYTK